MTLIDHQPTRTADTPCMFAYIRFSTDKQDERSQEEIIRTYINRAFPHTPVYKWVRDEGVSGGVSYKKRQLATLLDGMKEGDTLIVSELSRLTRGGIAELSEIIESYFKPRKIRLIIVNVGLDIDCTKLTPMTELQLAMLASFAKIEREQIRQRTKAALQQRKDELERNGYFLNKRGEKVTKLGAPKGIDTTKAVYASADMRRDAVLSNPTYKMIWGLFKDKCKDAKPKTEDYKNVLAVLNDMGIVTPKTKQPYSLQGLNTLYHRLMRAHARARV